MFSNRSRSTSIARCAAASALAVTLAVPLSGALAAQASGAVAGGAAASQAAQARPAASATAAAAHVGLRSTALGKLLVDGSGFTLYVFSRDRRDKDRCAAISGCTGVWPALTTHGRAVAGRGVKASWLGTIELPGGAHQVTYDGHPLYTYAFDSGPGATDYIGASEFGGVWHGLSASGKTVG
jgi:predicted lipoprotein with Yx(FWY)xxD motif